MRAAAYARFSTDLQSERSIEDQVELCRDFAARSGMSVVATFSDRAKSGASVFGRDGLMDMMTAAKARTFDVLLVEHTDRIARSMRDLADIHERLSFFGISIRAVHSGATLDTAMVGLFGLVGQMQREDGAKKVRRGMAGVVRDGRHAGGRAYGYEPVSGTPGHLQVVDGEADIVRRIFGAYTNGETPRAIAGTLNRDGITPPRGRFWNASTINGNRTRGSGILQNQLYAGRIVWNKVRMVKDPETGRRVSRPNAASEWQSADAPHLAIVDSATFEAAQSRKQLRAGMPHTKRSTPRRILSGLLRCGACGAGMSMHGRDRTGKTRIRCSASVESEVCDHRRKYYIETIEELTVRGLRNELRDPVLIAEYVAEYRAERKRLAGDRSSRRIKASTRLGEVSREIERLVDAIASGSAPAAAVGKRLAALEDEQRQLVDALAALETEAEIVTLHPAAVARYLAQIDDLASTLNAGGDITEGSAAASFRSLVESVTVFPVAPKQPLKIEVRGYLAELTNNDGLAPAYTVTGYQLVAEEGLEPPTRGL